MRLTFATYWPLLLAAVTPWLWRMRKSDFAGLNPRQLNLSTGVRTVIVTLLMFALMQPTLYRASSAISAVYLLDVSRSVAPAAVQNAIDWIRKTNDAGRPENSSFIAFAANSMTFEKLDDLSHVTVSNRAGRDAIDQSKTDIAAGLESAMRSFAPNHLKRLILISDGNENSGDVSALLPRLKQEGIRVDSVPLAVRASGDTWIETVMAPGEVNANEQFPVEVHVYSQTEGSGNVQIRYGAKTLAEREVPLKKGLNRVALETKLPADAGTAMLEATVTVTGDPFPENNIFRQPVMVLGQPRILYVEGHPPSAQYLKDALTTEGFAVEVADPAKLPSTAEELDAYDAVVLSDVDAKLLSLPQMDAINTYVRELGGGFILAGGENVYGASGYSKTPIEDLLPVTFDIKKPKQSVSTMVILDRSGSMAAEDKLLFAKEASKAPVTMLKDSDHFGVLTFNFNFSWAVHPTTVTDRPGIVKAIEGITASGETNLYPAMEEVFGELKKSTDEIKHVIILSDGRTLSEDFEGLTKEMVKAKITVSTVALGNDADQELLKQIADWGNGKAYYVQDASKVPQIFNQDMEDSAGDALNESAFRAVLKKKIDAFKGIDFNTAPPLQGFVQTKVRPTAEVALEAYKDRPLLARWQFGLGKTVFFASDLKDRWAVDWLHWSGYSKFWSQLIRETMRRKNDTDLDLVVQRQGDVARISANAVGKDGKYRDHLHLKAHIVAPDQSTSIVDVPQTGPGEYETRVPLTQDGTYLFRTSSDDSDGVSRTLAYSYPAEYHFYPPNFEMLRLLSRETGGTFQPAGPEIFDSNGETALMPFVLWPWLAALALALYLVDVLLRRIRIFEL